MKKIDPIKGVEGLDEKAVLAWAEQSQKRLRRLLERADRGTGVSRLVALEELDQMRRGTQWPPPYRHRLNENEKQRIRLAYPEVHTFAKQARAWFMPFFDGAAPLDVADVAEWVQKTKHAGKIAKRLRFTWSIEVIRDLCSETASMWVMKRFGARIGVTWHTVKNILQRGHRTDGRIEAKRSE